MLEHEATSPRNLPKIFPKISTARQTIQAQHIAQLGSDIRIARIQLYFLKAESYDLLDEVLEARMNDVENFKRHCRLRLAEETAKRKEDIVPFPVLWESSLLPFLCKFVTEWCGHGHSIGFVRGRSKNTKETLPPPRQICIMTTGRVTLARTLVIVHHIQDLLPEYYKSSIKVNFSEGKVVRLRWARGLDEARPDGICDPRNPHHFDEPCMGDSIGVGKTLAYEEETATLGPRIEKGDESYWLASYHPFVEIPKVAGPDIEHPSPADRRTCRGVHIERVEPTGDADNGARFSLGKLVKASGIDLKTTRITRDPFWTENKKPPPEIVMDWCLISSTGSGPNYLRSTSTGDGPRIGRRPVVSVAHVKPRALVVASGRTSGLQWGRIGESPMLINHGDGTAPTREWFIEQVNKDEDDNEWIMGGIGVQGDSGAAIVDAETSVLYGQLWGRNKNYGSGPRLAYFTPIHDILDDVVEKCEWDGAYPALPQVQGSPEGRVIENPTCCDPAPSPARVAATIPSTSALATSGGMRSREPSPPPMVDIVPLAQIGVDPIVLSYMGPGPMPPPAVVLQKVQVEIDVKKRRVSFGSDKIEDQAKRIKV